MSISSITVKDLHAKFAAGEKIEVIDVRMPKEYMQVHAVVARNYPLDSLDPRQIMLSHGSNGHSPLYVICKSGTRANMACRKFEEAGFDNIVMVEGGTSAWESAGLPVNRSEKRIKVIAIDRQMRIVAGSLVVLGVVLANINPWFIGLSAFVGAGLIFAGVTDYCPMMAALARMPWNRGQACAPCKA